MLYIIITSPVINSRAVAPITLFETKYNFFNDARSCDAITLTMQDINQKMAMVIQNIDTPHNVPQIWRKTPGYHVIT